MIGGEEKTEVKPVFCDDEANNFPTSLKFFKQSNDVFDHLLSVLKDSYWFNEDTIMRHVDVKEVIGDITFKLDDGKITGMYTMSRYGDSCFFYDEKREKVGLKGTLRLSKLKASYTQSVTFPYLSGGTSSNYERVYADIEHVDFSFKTLLYFKANCRYSNNCPGVKLKLKEIEVSDISLGNGFSSTIYFTALKKQFGIDKDKLRDQAKKMIRRNVKEFFATEEMQGHKYEYTTWGAVGRIQFWIKKALDANEEKFF